MKIIKILNYIFPLVIGALCSYMGTWSNIGIDNVIQIIMIFLLSIIFSVLLYYEARKELEPLHNSYSNIKSRFLLSKNIVIQLFAIIIGAICSSLGNWNKSQTGYSFKISIIVILAIIYIIFVIYSIYKDEKINENIKKYISKVEMLNEIYGNVQISIVYINHNIISELKNIQRDIHRGFILTDGIDKNINRLCQELYRIIARFDEGNFYVSYSKKMDDNLIMTIGYAGNGYIPDIYMMRRDINKDDYIDSKIMKQNDKSSFICYGKDNIEKLFSFHGKHELKYYMYFGIPVQINNEIRGLFQITYLSESTLFNERDNIEFLLSKIFPQYISITLLINEIYEMIYNNLPSTNTDS